MHKRHKETACPHCGKPLKRSSNFPLHTAASAVMLAAALFLLMSPGKWRPPSAVKALPADGAVIQPERASFIVSPAGAAACGPCLAAADAFAREKRLAAVRARTKGMELIPDGQYRIGSPDGVGDPDERPRHEVGLDAFYMDSREVSIADYMKEAGAGRVPYPEWAAPGGKFNWRTGANPHYTPLMYLFSKCPSCPVVGVTARNAADYCALSGKRLPTEAEWEAAARGGTETAFGFGNSPAAIDDYAWYEGNSGGAPHPGGQKRPNAFGLYDMHGNVWEWTADIYGRKYYAESPLRSPTGPEKGFENVLRGGSWAFEAEALRSGNRASNAKANDDIGFRCAAGKTDMERLAEAEVSAAFK